ncbi:MAG: molybdenum cofactor biosynthesis protein MoaE [Verrucomicrobia bacterium]|nr:MAG: molybdenum cofactor biosynthesis protein MoaE [Verrucomicrobiota bacterium]
MRFEISSQPIDPAELRRTLENIRAGACVTFEGWVRDFNEGRTVLRLAYEAFDTLAVKEGERILEEAKRDFDIFDICCVHRSGVLELGDLAVWVGVSAQHRGAAFDACRYVIDEVKTRVPIWKKEFYEDGDSGWINAGAG